MPKKAENKGYASIADSPKRAQLPSNIEAEQAVLATCLLSPEAADEIIVQLKAENFFRASHRIIFDAIYETIREGNSPDAISLSDKLQANGKLEEAGGRVYIADLNANTFAYTNWRKHVEIVKRTAIQRELIRAAAEINALAYDAPEDLSEVVEEAEQSLFNVTEKRVSSTFVKMEDLVSAAFEDLSKLSEKGDKMLGVPTGFKDVDDLFHGFRGGDLIILAARPGVGKTSLALNMAINAAKKGVSVAFFSLEMNNKQLMQRILCSEARITGSHIASGHVTESDWSQIYSASKELSNLDMYIDDTPGLSIMQARAKSRRQMRGAINLGKPGLIVVDYLQLMQPPSTRRDGNRAVEVGEISRGLKIMAKELDMPVIALSQLNRAVEMGGKKRPQLSNLRESGSIEQDADIVMFIDRSLDAVEAEDSKRPPLGAADLIVAKHRNGRTADIRLSFTPEYTKFGDYYDESRSGGI